MKIWCRCLQKVKMIAQEKKRKNCLLLFDYLFRQAGLCLWCAEGRKEERED